MKTIADSDDADAMAKADEDRRVATYMRRDYGPFWNHPDRPKDAGRDWTPKVVSQPYAGIDYSAGQPINRDTKTGIRYGVIPVNDLNPDAVEDIYSNGTDEDYEDWKQAIIDGIKSALSDYLSARAIQRVIDNGLDGIGDDYQSTGDCTRYSYERDGYKLQTDSSGDLWVIESPYFTYAQFCSPCAPGACYLRSPLDVPANELAAENKCYCLGPEWFDDEKAPYTVFGVASLHCLSAFCPPSS